ncbi:hypothetical protein B0T26DRAFT_804870 [Lasiosphaeria miniovina]|uniref:DUF6546 domain-containing protein n=1 Tax=Lasiosphaeria miniovina TaxID=1954250 RepID=A0AA40DMX4_9PEZI|nr:uncharacterized protein B0T26DRAFT_804870 [Lasiosphaeria miniovina]KAK0709070.1 hypothetical protein B0T26DRAFT_804870 [Lasiosphaeria miniovina]
MVERDALRPSGDRRAPTAANTSAMGAGLAGTRVPNHQVSSALAMASLELEYLSASFMVDAADFFDACRPSWKWPNLTSLALTSQLLTPDRHWAAMIDKMLQAAAAAGIEMPRLETMEIWNGGEGLAALFRYQSGRCSSIYWTC